MLIGTKRGTSTCQYFGQRLFEIGNDVVDVLDADERRTTSGPAPAAIFCSSESWRWVVDAGWMTSELRVADIGEMREELEPIPPTSCRPR